ncbi:hypothetical protein AAD018_005715 [Aestuariibius insulae]|uniref:hypothetical protein n=1 Tax=Aestuariibius insulae TaxID=2058287 RepID=UPI00345EF972
MIVETIGSSSLFPTTQAPKQTVAGSESGQSADPKEETGTNTAPIADGEENASSPPREAPPAANAPTEVTPAKPQADPLLSAGVAVETAAPPKQSVLLTLDPPSPETSVDEARARAADVQKDLRIEALIDQVTSITDPAENTAEATRFAEDASVIREIAGGRTGPEIDLTN